ncbi:hypothetical protein [Arthrobacter sp. TE12232]
METTRERASSGAAPACAHLKFYNENRGYVNTTNTKDELTADFPVLDCVTTPGSRKPPLP